MGGPRGSLAGIGVGSLIAGFASQRDICQWTGTSQCHQIFKELLDRLVLKFTHPEAFLLKDGKYGVVAALQPGGALHDGASCEKLWKHLGPRQQQATEFTKPLLCKMLDAAKAVGLLQADGEPKRYTVTPEMTKGEPLLQRLFGYFVMLVIVGFFVTSIEQFAQMHAKEVDQ